MQSLLKDLRSCFRSEYLGALIQRVNNKMQEQKLTIENIVLVWSDNKKCIHWPLGHITENFPEKDKKIHLVKVKTSEHEFLHPIQRIYPLEITLSKDSPKPNKAGNSNEFVTQTVELTIPADKKPVKKIKFWIKIKIPERLNLWKLSPEYYDFLYLFLYLYNTQYRNFSFDYNL